MGWSFANEMFALGRLNKIPEKEFDVYQAKLAEFGQIAHSLDPTRPWISCDGDEDLNGRLDIWIKHWGDGWKDKQNTHYRLPEDDSKPWMLGEYSGSYYLLCKEYFVVALCQGNRLARSERQNIFCV